MDLYRIIAELRARRARIDESIAQLECLGSACFPVAKRRGRRRMEMAERERVSARMKQYWAKRRRDRAEAPLAGGANLGRTDE